MYFTDKGGIKVSWGLPSCFLTAQTIYKGEYIYQTVFQTGNIF